MQKPRGEHVRYALEKYLCCIYFVPRQVNGIPLIGETHKEVVNILKELPMCVYLVCSRIVPPSVRASNMGEDDACLSLKDLLAEFNDKVRAQSDETTLLKSISLK